MKLSFLNILPFPEMVFSSQTPPLRGHKAEPIDDLPLFNHNRRLNTINAGDEGTLCLVSDIRPGSGSSSPNHFTVFNGKLYFSAFDGTHGRELWEYDGTSTPTMVADINPGSASSFPSYLTKFNNKLYFSASDGMNGIELWVYDGSSLPSLAADINPSGDSTPKYLTAFNDMLYFSADSGTNGTELWVHDGASSSMLDINPGTGSSSPGYLAVFNNSLYFQANNGTNGYELWTYNGALPPTMVADVNPGGGSFGPSFFLSSMTSFTFKLMMAPMDMNSGSWIFLQPWLSCLCSTTTED
jgi:ELWxxDGT repeat protein